MSEFVEKVAEAIYDKMTRHDGFPKPNWKPDGYSFKQDEARDMARAAIEAMKRPTQEMVDAGNKAAGVWNSNLSYPAMISAALKS